MLSAFISPRLTRHGDIAIGPYIERAEPQASHLDRMLSQLQGHLGAYLRPKRPAGLARIADAVDALGPKIERLSDVELRQAADALRSRLLPSGFALPEVARAFALTREVSYRRLGKRHHRVQLMGGWVMLKGGLAEMETGQGKTITALLPAVTAALANLPVHVITVNDYLAQRDSEQLRPVYEAFGLSVGLAQHGQSPEERRAAYGCDVTFCTNKDVVFDYLRDRMAIGQRRARSRLLIDELLGTARTPLLLRGLCFAIVDEADSVLIDEAKTPLILSGPTDAAREAVLYRAALELGRQLVAERDFHVAAQKSSVELTPEGKRRSQELASCAGVPPEETLWASPRAREELIGQALSALHLFKLDKHYIVADGKVQIVDEYTGRVMADRSWERGLHQMIELKEGCEMTGQRRTQARITYQRFFRRYMRLCGMSGTAGEAAGELLAVYGLRVIRIPTHGPVRRRNLGTQLCVSSEEKWRRVIERVIVVAGEGRPVLIGTRSVAASEAVSQRLHAAGLPQHSVLNARQDRAEAEVVAQAGGPSRITVATNIAGRGTDIHLEPAVVAAGGLHVILTEFHESARIDRQLFGRCARQGNPGSIEAVVSLEDELFRRFLGPVVGRIAAALHRDGALPLVTARLGDWLRWWAQLCAERLHARTRRDTVKQDRRLDQALAFAGRSE
jgi:preprotein translocase subunit SecA